MSWLQSLIDWLGGALIALAAAMGLGGGGPLQLQGYVEGEYVYVAAPVAGRLQTLEVARGAKVAGRRAAVPARPRQRAAGARRCRRPPRAGRGQPRQPRERQAPVRDRGDQGAARPGERDAPAVGGRAAAPGASGRDPRRQPRGAGRGPAPRTSATRRGSRELEAELETAQLGARADEIEAAEAAVSAARAQLAQAQWRLDQMGQPAPQAGLVVDTLYRPGEWVTRGRAGRPAAAARQRQDPLFRARGAARQRSPSATRSGRCDGCAPTFAAAISFISPDAEYTPPVIYSREKRAKLVFMVEARPREPGALRPGQPVDVTLPPAPTS